MLTPEQHATFEERGWVRLPAAFAREDAADMEAAVWAFLERKFGAHRDRPETWNFGLASGLQSLKRRAVFQAIGGAAAVGALDDLLGPGRWIPTGTGDSSSSPSPAEAGSGPSRAASGTRTSAS